MNPDALIHAVYLFSAVALLLGLRMMTVRSTARRGLFVAVAGLVSALIATLLDPRIERFEYVLGGLALGVFAGMRIARQQRAWPAMALLCAGGALGAFFSGWAEFHAHAAGQGISGGILLWLAVVLGGMAASGSLAIWKSARQQNGEARAGGAFSTRSISFRIALAILLISGVLFSRDTVAPGAYRWFAVAAAFALLLGYLWAASLEAALIPAALALTTAATGLAACALGLTLRHPLLVAAGALAGGSGLALARAMCRAENRTFSALLGIPAQKEPAGEQESARP